MPGMKRFWMFGLPAGTALLAGGLFSAGFYMVLTGRLGERVSSPASTTLAPAAGGRMAILFLGDSLARGTGDESAAGIAGALDDEMNRRHMEHSKPVNLAVNGAKTRDLLRLLDARNVTNIASASQVIFVSIGGNDLFGAAGTEARQPAHPDEVMSPILVRVGTIVDRLRHISPRARIFLLGLYNPFALQAGGRRLDGPVERWNAQLLQQFGGDAQVTIIPTFDLFSHRQRLSADRFHPGKEGYQLIARRMAEAL
jgi:lysophospholipase L1-like esterase